MNILLYFLLVSSTTTVLGLPYQGVGNNEKYNQDNVVQNYPQAQETVTPYYNSYPVNRTPYIENISTDYAYNQPQNYLILANQGNREVTENNSQPIENSFNSIPEQEVVIQKKKSISERIKNKLKIRGKYWGESVVDWTRQNVRPHVDNFFHYVGKGIRAYDGFYGR